MSCEESRTGVYFATIDVLLAELTIDLANSIFLFYIHGSFDTNFHCVSSKHIYQAISSSLRIE